MLFDFCCLFSEKKYIYYAKIGMLISTSYILIYTI